QAAQEHRLRFRAAPRPERQALQAPPPRPLLGRPRPHHLTHPASSRLCPEAGRDLTGNPPAPTAPGITGPGFNVIGPNRPGTSPGNRVCRLLPFPEPPLPLLPIDPGTGLQAGAPGTAPASSERSWNRACHVLAAAGPVLLLPGDPGTGPATCWRLRARC